MSPTAPTLVGAFWLVAGCAVAVRLGRAGHPAAEVVLAVPCWPLFLGAALARPVAAPAISGPYAARIRDAVARLSAALAEDPAASPFDLGPLASALARADARLGRLDALLGAEGVVVEAPPTSLPADDPLAALLGARAASAAELEAVLAELRRLRILAGLRALDAEAPPLSAPLADLLARARALDEVAALPPLGAPSRPAPRPSEEIECTSNP